MQPQEVAIHRRYFICSYIFILVQICNYNILKITSEDTPKSVSSIESLAVCL